MKRLLAVVLCIAIPFVLAAQSNTNVPAGTAASAGSLSLEDVIKLSKAGVDDDVIIQKIKKQGQPFDLTTDQLIQLKSASVSSRVIQVMLDPAKTDAAQAPASTAAKAQPGSDPGLPSDIGIYAKRQGQWVEVMPEVVNWKSGGVVKSVATVGVVKGDVNGHLPGKHSHNNVTTPLEFLIVVPEGVAITEYQLLHLRENGNNREFRTVTGGVFHVSGGATRDLLQYDGKKVGKRQYQVALGSTLEKGEYGFLPPGAVADRNAAASSGKLYSFQIVE